MREIEFRGKAGDGKWYYGDYTRYSIHEAGITVNFDEEDIITVDAGTVGQYIGLTDKNEKRIYDDDIVIMQRGCGLPPVTGKIIYTDLGPGCYVCYATDDNGSIDHLISIFGNQEYTDKFYDNGKALNLEVIGNIRDDPSFKDKLEAAERLTE